MTLDRAIRLLQIEKEYCLKQTGFQKQPINKEIAEALDIAITVLKERKKNNERNMGADKIIEFLQE